MEYKYTYNDPKCDSDTWYRIFINYLGILTSNLSLLNEVNSNKNLILILRVECLHLHKYHIELVKFHY